MAQPLPPAVPGGPLPPGGETAFHSFLLEELEAVVAAAAGPILNAGMDMWAGLATMLIVWTGLRIAMSGTFHMWEVVELVFAIAMPRAMLGWYMTPVPGVGLTFPGVVTGMGQWIHAQLYYATTNDLLIAITARAQRAWAAADLTGGQGMSVTLTGLLTNFGFWLDAVLDTIFSIVFSVSLYLLFSLVMLITLAQVIWAQIAMTIAMILGPIFIPFLMFSPLAFLFWGWFRTVVVYSLYAAIAAAVGRVFVTVGLRLLDRVTIDASLNGTVSDWIDGLLLALPFLVACLLASLKIGELASLLVSGAGAVSSGAGRMVGGAAGGAAGARMMMK